MSKHYGKNGFIDRDVPTDAQVLALSQSIIDEKRLSMNVYEYLEWKIQAAKIALEERIELKDLKEYNPNLDQRINYTLKVIDYSRSKLKEQEGTKMKVNKVYATFEKFKVYYNTQSEKYLLFINGIDEGSFEFAADAISKGQELTDS